MINKFLSHTKILESGCVVWIGYIDSDGYGRFYCKPKKYGAHRWIYEYHNGKIPKGLYVDHICRFRACVNIYHLKAVTPKQNALENSLGPSAINASMDYCIYGHKLYLHLNGRRRCVICDTEYQKWYYQDNKEKKKVDRRQRYLLNKTATK